MKNISIVSLGLFLLPLLSFAFEKNALVDHYWRQQALRKQMEADAHNNHGVFGAAAILADPASPPKLESGFFHQKLNHASSNDPTTFGQRYFVDSTFAVGPKAPVFFYVCGEFSCSANYLRGLPLFLAEQFKGHAVALEHRYYGLSTPFETYTPENLAYLSTDFALNDLSVFQKALSKKMNLEGPWVAIGGSYAGSLAAYYRLKYPQNVVGAVASSAPVKAKQNFEEYDQQTALALGPSCAKKVRDFIEKLETEIEDPELFNKWRNALHAPLADSQNYLLVFTADVAEFAVQYGYHQSFCARLEKEEALTVYGDYTRSLAELIANDTEGGKNAIAWSYQTCSEYGYFATSFHDRTQSVQSAKITLDSFTRFCELYFEAPAKNESAINAKYFDQLSKATNIYFTNGAFDPWRVLSVLNTTGTPDLDSSVLQGYAHCSDVSYQWGPDELSTQGIVRAKTIALIQKWISQTNLAGE